MGITRREFIKTGTLGLGAFAIDGMARGMTPQTPGFSRVAFGSCLSRSGDAAALDVVLKAAPQAFVWLGDNIYGDTEDMDLLKAKYGILAGNPRFQKLKSACPMMAIWDDHDFGLNNSASEFIRKKESQEIFLDFWDVPPTDPRRKREGIYHSLTFGEGERTLQFILLDGRYHRTTDKTDADGTMLGEAQWKWLEDRLKDPATLRIICCGIQVVADEHGFEGWCEFPKERRRLYDLVRNTRSQGVVFTSGDQHWGELSRADGVLGYPAYDLTASSLDQSWPLPVNGKRIGAGTPDPNFGMIEVEWDRPDPLIHFKLLTADQGRIILDETIPLSLLQPWGPVAVKAKTNAMQRDQVIPRDPGIPGDFFRKFTVSGRRLPR